MEIYNLLLLIAGIAGAITTICKLGAKIIELVKKCIHFFIELNRKIDKVEEHCAENYLMCLKLVVMSEEIPIEERLNAGEKYVNLNGNGEVKAKYRALQEEYLKGV